MNGGNTVVGNGDGCGECGDDETLSGRAPWLSLEIAASAIRVVVSGGSPTGAGGDSSCAVSSSFPIQAAATIPGGSMPCRLSLGYTLVCMALLHRRFAGDD